MKKEIGWKLFDWFSWILFGGLWILLVMDVVREMIEAFLRNGPGDVAYGFILLFYFVPGSIGLYLLWIYHRKEEKKASSLRLSEGLLTFQGSAMLGYLLRKFHVWDLWENRTEEPCLLYAIILFMGILVVSTVRIQNGIGKKSKNKRL